MMAWEHLREETGGEPEQRDSVLAVGDSPDSTTASPFLTNLFPWRAKLLRRWVLGWEEVRALPRLNLLCWQLVGKWEGSW